MLRPKYLSHVDVEASENTLNDYNPRSDTPTGRGNALDTPPGTPGEGISALNPAEIEAARRVNSDARLFEEKIAKLPRKPPKKVAEGNSRQKSPEIPSNH